MGLKRNLAYPVLVGGALAALAWTLHLGAGLRAPHLDDAAASVAASSSATGVFRLPVFLAQLVIVILLSRGLGRMMRRLGQPQVVGEMIGGLLLGPSAFGALAPSAYATLFPAGSVRFLNAVSQLGVLLFMFLVGLELDLGVLRKQRRTVMLSSHAGIAIPLWMGAALALVLYPRLSNDSVSFVAFALFIGCALSVTAFPVLARLLAERGLSRTPFGALAIACAAVADITAWCLLAVVLAVAEGRLWGVHLWASVAGAVLFVVFMMTAARRAIAKVLARASYTEHLTSEALALVVVVALGAAWVTEQLGIHALLGAFVAGLAMPKTAAFVASITGRLEELLGVVLLPLFFAVTGIRTNLGSIEGGAMWVLCAVMVLVATIGKAGGTIVGARTSGLSWRAAASLGALMNTRGLMELVIINLGLEIGIITRPIFAMMVLMAILTTALTAPALALLRCDERFGSHLEHHSPAKHARPLNGSLAIR
jgi:Kef-type K+ transport system membrane component KefB